MKREVWLDSGASQGQPHITASTTLCLVSGNTATGNWGPGNWGGGLKCNARVFIRSSTIVDNNASGICLHKGTLDVANSILWGNGDEIFVYQDGQIILRHTCIEDTHTGEGVIHDDPGFVSYVGADYRLEAGSSCIDAGDGTMAPAADFFGNPRWDDPDVLDTGIGTPSSVDIGYHEWRDGNGDGAMDEWQVSIGVTGAHLAELILGMSAQGTEAFDAGLDWQSPPAAQGVGYAALAIPGDDLARDFRPRATEAEWMLYVATASDPVELSWDTASVPYAGLYMTEVDANGEAVPGGVPLMINQHNHLTAPADTTATFAIRFPGLIVFELTLHDGWNLVSLPIQPAGTVEHVFQGASSGPVWGWDGTAYAALTEIVAGQGCWVFHAAGTPGGSTTMDIRGIPAQSTQRGLTDGWNLIGPVSVPPYEEVALPLTSNPSNSLIAPIWGWNGSIYFAETEALDMGQGYWGSTNGACSLELGR